MKRAFRPKYDSQLSFDETKYPEGRVLAFICPQCGTQFKIKLGRKVVETTAGEEKKAEEPNFPCGYITIVENGFAFKQDLPLAMGDNVIGHRDKDTEGVDVPIVTSDPNIGHKHYMINVKKNVSDRFVYMVRDSPSLTGTFVENVLVGKKEQVRIGEGTVVTIGATTFILHSANEGEEGE